MKKKILFAALFIAASFNVFCQTADYSNRFLSRSVDSAVVLLQSDYILRDTAGEDYFRKDNYYSRITSIGVYANGMFHIAPIAVDPWKSDGTLKKLDLMSDGGKTPVLSQVTAQVFPFVEEKEIEPFFIDTATFIVDEKEMFKGRPGLKSTHQKGTVDAWIVLYAKENKPGSGLKQIFHEKKITLSEAGVKDMMLDGIAFPDGFAGGLVLVPVSKTGTIEVEIAGLAYAGLPKPGGQLLWSSLETPSTDLKKKNTKTAEMPAGETKTEKTEAAKSDTDKTNNKKTGKSGKIRNKSTNSQR